MYSGNYDFQLTPHFNLNEFIVSVEHPNVAKKIRFTELDGIKAQQLASTILEPTRMYFNKQAIITSGKCSTLLNALIPGRSKTTQHSWVGPDCVVDFVIPGVEADLIFKWIKLRLMYAFGQLICYPGKQIHVGLPTHKHQGEAFIK